MAFLLRDEIHFRSWNLVSGEIKVRSANGLIPWHSNQEQGFTISGIRDWRAAEGVAGRPNELDDFYAAHGLCFDCGAAGAVMVGWSDPTDEFEAKTAQEHG